MFVSLRAVFLAALCVPLLACGELPRGAAVEYEILAGANDENADFAVYPVSRAFLPTLELWPVVGDRQLSWIGTSRGSTSNIITHGDTLSLRIWDSGDNSLLTATEQRSVDMVEMKVSSTGTIFVPYVGDVVVSGQTSDAARRSIQRQLETIVPSAQVQLSVASGRKNSVDLVGGVENAGTYPLPDPNFTVLNLLALAGGVNEDLDNPQIRLVRNGQIFGTSVATLFENPSLDTRLAGGDKVLIEEDRRYFVSLGSSGQEDIYYFPKDRVTAIDAMSLSGGVNTTRGDPQSILILREYPASALQPGASGPRRERVIFAVDLTSSDGLFSARKFNISSGDVVLVTESPVTNIRTVLGLFGLALGSVSTVVE